MRELSQCQVHEGHLVVPELFLAGSVQAHSGNNPYTADLINLREEGQMSRQDPPPLLSMVTTPLRLWVWEAELARHPDKDFAEYVISGIRDGFRIGFRYHDRQYKSAKRNLKSAGENPQVVEEYLHKELEKARLIGPLEKGQLAKVQVSPFGVIPKSQPGKWRLIVNLSSPQGSSVYDGIDRALCSLSYVTVDDIVAVAVRQGQGAQLAKFDLEAAYRMVPVHPQDRHLLGMEWKGKLFVDTALPFGLRWAPKIFNAVADGLEWMIRRQGVKEVAHYLDDFIIVGPPKSQQCSRDLSIALDVCARAGAPVAPHKIAGPSTELPFLGIELDMSRMELRLPFKKLDKLRELINQWRPRKSCTRHELESLVGHLCHACKVVRPGRRFLRGMFGLLSLFRRQLHPIRLSKAFKADLEWWYVFLESWNGVSMLRERRLQGPFGGWGDQWFQIAWSEFPQFSEAPIAAQELLPILVAVALWGGEWAGKTIRCNCDNQAVVCSIRGGYCREVKMAHMLRCLFFLEAKLECTVTAVHVPGLLNGPADAISRNSMQSFFTLLPQVRLAPVPVPRGIVEGLMREDHWTSTTWVKWLSFISKMR